MIIIDFEAVKHEGRQAGKGVQGSRSLTVGFPSWTNARLLQGERLHIGAEGEKRKKQAWARLAQAQGDSLTNCLCSSVSTLSDGRWRS